MVAKKILLISTDYNHTPPEGYGGIERIVALVYKYYIDLGYEVDVASAEGSSFHTFNHDKLFTLDFSQYSFVLCYKYFEEILQLLDEAPTVAHIILQNNFSPKLKFLGDLKKCKLYVLSQDQQQQYLINTGKLYPIIPNFTDSTHFKITKNIRPLDIVSIGMLGQHKSPIACLQYAKKHNLSIDFYGPLSFLDEESDYQKEFMRQLDEYPKAHLLGEIGDDAKMDVLNKYKYFIFLAGLDKIEWTEPFGIAPLEALLCGCTLITHYQRGGHLSFADSSNSIEYTGMPNQLDIQKVRDSVLRFDYKKIIAEFYPH